VTHVRGTVLANSLAIVRDRGLRDAYEARLPAEHHATMASLTPQAWFPVDFADAHYGVLSTLITDRAEQIEIGRESAARIQLNHLKTLFRAMRVTGAVTPARALTLVQKVVDRVMQGGDVAVYRTGMKDAEIVCRDIPMVRHQYFRNSWAGWYERSLELTSPRVFVGQRRAPDGPESCVYTVSWV